MNDVVKEQLAALADTLDGPEGPGSGAVCLDAIAAIEALERLVPALEPSTG